MAIGKNGDLIPSEYEEQSAVVAWAANSVGKFPELEFLYAVPNGEPRNRRVAQKLKASGVKPGVLDLVLPVARGGYFGLYLEMKRREKSTTSRDQKRWMRFLIGQGYFVGLAKGAAQGIAFIEAYLRATPTKKLERYAGG